MEFEKACKIIWGASRKTDLAISIQVMATMIGYDVDAECIDEEEYRVYFMKDDKFMFWVDMSTKDMTINIINNAMREKYGGKTSKISFRGIKELL